MFICYFLFFFYTRLLSGGGEADSLLYMESLIGIPHKCCKLWLCRRWHITYYNCIMQLHLSILLNGFVNHQKLTGDIQRGKFPPSVFLVIANKYINV